MVIAWSRLNKAQRSALAQMAMESDVGREALRLARARDLELSQGDMLVALARYDGPIKVLEAQSSPRISELLRKRAGAMSMRYYAGTGVGA